MSVTTELREAVAERDGWHCRYCGRQLVAPPAGRNHTAAEASRIATLDHWLPRARGGEWEPDNLVMACRPCNEDKGTLTGPEYMVVLAYRRQRTGCRPVAVPAPVLRSGTCSRNGSRRRLPFPGTPERSPEHGTAPPERHGHDAPHSVAVPGEAAHSGSGRRP